MAHPFPPAVYAARRMRLLALLDHRVALVPSAGYDGSGRTFRQASDFLYLTGLDVPNSVLLLDGNDGSCRLYVPQRDERFYRPGRENAFRGRPLCSDPGLQKVSAIVDIRRGARLTRDLGELTAARRRFAVSRGAWDEPAEHEGSELAAPSAAAHAYRRACAMLAPAAVDNLYPMMATLRQVKGPEEVVSIASSCWVAAFALRVAMATIRPGQTERDLEAAIEAGFKLAGAQGVAFSSIVKSGPNSVLPWPILGADYDRRNRRMTSGELVIADVGCEVDYYISDIARTMPVDGAFRSEQAELYDIVCAAADAAIAAARPGMTYADLEERASACCPARYRPWWDRGLGHFIGLESSDPADYGACLAPGMVLTIEPRIYVPERALGAMVEDNIVITTDGADVLSYGAPRTRDEIEAAMAAEAGAAGWLVFANRFDRQRAAGRGAAVAGPPTAGGEATTAAPR